jgi:hypothetical protein
MTHGGPPFFPSLAMDVDILMHAIKTPTDVDREGGPCRLLRGGAFVRIGLISTGPVRPMGLLSAFEDHSSNSFGRD